MDDGAHWTQFKDGLPPAPVSWIVVEPRFHDVVVSTYGRGLYILPDITMLEQTGQATRAAGDAAVRADGRASGRRAAARAGVPALRSPRRRRPPVEMEILDAAGKVDAEAAASQARQG